MSVTPKIIQIQVTEDDVLSLVEQFIASAEQKPDYIHLKWQKESVPSEVLYPLLDVFSDEKIAVVGIISTKLSPNPDLQLDSTTKVQVPLTRASNVVIRGSVLFEFSADLRDELGINVSIEDISMFLNRFGYSTVEIFVNESHLAETTSDRTITAKQSRTWDGYVEHVENFLAYGTESFILGFKGAELNTVNDLLIDATGLPEKINGTSRVALGLLRELENYIKLNHLINSITVIVSKQQIQRLSQQFPSLNFLTHFPDIHRKFSIGFSITPVTSIGQCFEMSVRCLRWVVLQLDIIAIRSYPHLSQQMSALEAFRFVHRYADLIIYISSFSASDANKYLNENVEAEQQVCLLGIPDSFAEISDETRSTTGSIESVLILGNDDPHKQVERIANKFLQAGVSVSTITSKAPLGELHQIYQPGSLTDRDLSELLRKSSSVVFPSLYEGFGLPVIEAAKLGRPVLVWDTAINRELVDKFDLTNVYTCSSSKQLVETYLHVRNNKTLIQNQLRRMSQFDAEVVSVLENKLASEIDLERIVKRWEAINSIGSAFEESQRKLSQLEIEGKPKDSLKLLLWKLGHKLVSCTSSE